MIKHFPLALLSLALLVHATACHGTLPCPDCDEQADAEDEQEDDGPLPDLPCGGADLMTDNLNCGSCGNECYVFFEGLEWEAGSCQAGKCGPVWLPCMTSGFGATCEELCASYESTCVANGCSGLTGLLLVASIWGWGTCLEPESILKTMAGACDEPIPWNENEDDFNNASCCCGGE
jgi:hypothetical protein